MTFSHPLLASTFTAARAGGPSAVGAGTPPGVGPPEPVSPPHVPAVRRGRPARARAARALTTMLVGCVVLGACTAPEAPPPADVPAGPGGPTAGPVRCEYPAQVLDLRRWKLTLPYGAQDDISRPMEITQPGLTSFASAPYFHPTADCSGVVFRAGVNAPTTSGSKYPRSELREMNHDGSKADWSSTVGTHIMTMTGAFTALPEGKPHLVGAQIHDDSDDISVFRLEGSKLYVTDGDNPNYKLITDNYVLGTRFEAKFVVSGGIVQAYYNGELQATLHKEFSAAYFKAGAYTQANCERVAPAPCGADNYGETVIYRLEVTHQ
jgi:Alginate lyase